MTRLFYSDGAARIVVIQQNWLTAPKYMGNPMEACATTASRVRRGWDATKNQRCH